MENNIENWRDLSSSELFEVVSNLYSERCKIFESYGMRADFLFATAQGDIMGLPDPKGSHIYVDEDGMPFYLLAYAQIILDLTNFEWIS